MGFGLPLPALVGPIVWILAAAETKQVHNWPALAMLVLPLTGALTHRDYWGLLTLPITIIFAPPGAARLASWAGRRRARNLAI